MQRIGPASSAKQRRGVASNDFDTGESLCRRFGWVVTTQEANMATATAARENGVRPRSVSVTPTPMEPAQENKPVTIGGIKLATIDIKLRGTSPLLVHAWSEKAIRMIQDKQGKVAKQAKEARNPDWEVVDSLYWITGKPSSPAALAKMGLQKALDGGKFALPACVFKHTAVAACSFVDGMTKVIARGAFHVIGKTYPHIAGQWVEIDGPAPRRHDAMVRIGMGTADVRYRGEFPEWSVVVRVNYNANVISPEQIVNLYNIAGFSCGVGEHRPSCDGSCGCFSVS